MIIAGLDEVGRGAVAGPVMAGCVILPDGIQVPDYITDSKALSALQREVAATWIRTYCHWAVGAASHTYIDAHGILAGTRLAMLRALRMIQKRGIHIDALYIDGRDNFTFPLPATFFIRGDALHACIAAASIVAKVERDTFMAQFDTRNRYGFATNKGYGTKKQQSGIQQYGLHRLHRRTFVSHW